jgi:hypothetical protein
MESILMDDIKYLQRARLCSMTKYITFVTKLLGFYLFNGATTRATDITNFFAPFAQATHMCLMTAFKHISSPYDIIGWIF